MGCGDRSVTFIEEYRITNPCMGQQETAPEITNQTPNNRQTEMLMDRKLFRWMLGLRMGGLTALDLCDVVIEVSNSSNDTKSSAPGAAGNRLRNSNTTLKKKGHRDVDKLLALDHVVTNASSSQREAPLKIFEDNERSDQDDHQRTKSDDETRVQNPKSCVGLCCCLTESTCTPRSKSSMLTPKTTWGHVNRR